MKIAIVADNFDMGGIQRVSKVIGEKLSEIHDVHFYSMYRTDNYYGIEKNFVSPTIPFIYEFLIKACSKSLRSVESIIKNGEFSQVRYRIFFLKRLIHFIEANKIETVILTSPVLIASIFYLKNYTNAKYVAWIHNNYDTYINKYTKGYNREFYKGLGAADKVICLTKYDYSQFLLLNNNTTYIYNPLTINNKNISSLREKKISFTGRIEFKHKGIDYLVEIAKRIPDDWKIEIAGSGKKKQVDKLIKLIKFEQLEKKVIFKGPLKEELAEHYLGSSIYLMTSRWEGMPLVLAEAMSFGLPIIAFSQTGSNEVLNFGKYGDLVENGDIKEMSKRLNNLINSFEKREKYQKLSLKRVKDFNLEQIVEEWLSIIEECEGNE
ncbi:glycosyltransferase [Tetragenococcus koreensis]|uniref:glycosyltransferase n=1 Tax=Tetragenococcus koreensis TaxID=290335 RepID=UPI001F2790F6|nr:glycosyltransferase [Tetragenococcus koreensis]MCF1613603.1 glycosyltransferase [Tetragenococcus koreensis]MCF1623401.1 glycosyltransferase [Tetragenococcus koreensis]